MSQELLTESGPIEIRSYPDGMPLVSWNGAALDRILLRPRSMASFVAAMFWIDAQKERGLSTPHLILPFVPGARQDRLNDSGDYLFTVKSIAVMINARGFPSVTVLDPHSDVTPALIDRCRVVHAADCISAPPGKYQAVISPDAGAEKRAGAVARKLGVPLIHAWKTRDVSTGAITGFGAELSDVRFRAMRLLVADDICDGGGTFVGLAQHMRKSWCGGEQLDLHLFTTHGIFSKGVEPLLAHYSHIYCTDSVIADRPGVIHITVCKNLLEKGTP